MAEDGPRKDMLEAGSTFKEDLGKEVTTEVAKLEPRNWRKGRKTPRKDAVSWNLAQQKGKERDRKHENRRLGFLLRQFEIEVARPGVKAQSPCLEGGSQNLSFQQA